MRRNSLSLLFLLLFLMSCAGDTYRKMRIELPSYSPLHLEEFQELVLTEFLIAGSPEGFDLSQELASFFVPEFERKLRLPITVQRVQLEREESFRQADFWPALAPGPSRRLYVTGRAELTREVRKAILDDFPGKDPFSPQRKIAARTFFVFSLHLFLIRGENGQVLLDRDFKETATYTSADQRTDFAFHDLALRVRTKLFRQLLSEERVQQRYLLPK